MIAYVEIKKIKTRKKLKGTFVLVACKTSSLMIYGAVQSKALFAFL